MAQIVAITGGIGSGKSVVSHVLRCMGYAVLDTDACARRLMNQSQEVKHELMAKFGPEIYDDRGLLIASALSAKVFDNAEQLHALNAIVHPAVKRYTEQWATDNDNGNPVFVETALLYAAGMDEMVNCIWRVTAPERVRIFRVKRRNGFSEEQIKRRMQSQASEMRTSDKDFEIVNDGLTALLPQIIKGLNELTHNE